VIHEILIVYQYYQRIFRPFYTCRHGPRGRSNRLERDDARGYPRRQNRPPVAALDLAMVHAPIYDTLNSIVHHFEFDNIAGLEARRKISDYASCNYLQSH